MIFSIERKIKVFERQNYGGFVQYGLFSMNLRPQIAARLLKNLTYLS